MHTERILLSYIIHKSLVQQSVHTRLPSMAYQFCHSVYISTLTLNMWRAVNLVLLVFLPSVEVRHSSTSGNRQILYSWSSFLHEVLSDHSQVEGGQNIFLAYIPECHHMPGHYCAHGRPQSFFSWSSVQCVRISCVFHHWSCQSHCVGTQLIIHLHKVSKYFSLVSANMSGQHRRAHMQQQYIFAQHVCFL